MITMRFNTQAFWFSEKGAKRLVLDGLRKRPMTTNDVMEDLLGALSWHETNAILQELRHSGLIAEGTGPQWRITHQGSAHLRRELEATQIWHNTAVTKIARVIDKSCPAPPPEKASTKSPVRPVM